MRATFESAGRSELALLWGLLQLLCRFDGVLDGSSADENASELLRLLRGSAAAEGAIPSPLATSPASPEAYQLAAHKLESLLLEGQREAACEHAMASGMWADALLISSHMDADTWRAVMTRFANETLAPGSPLKTLYALFAGSGVAAFEAPGSSPGGAAGAATFAPSREASEAAAARTAEHWRSNLAMMLANPTAGDTDVIARLGDQIWSTHGAPAAHGHLEGTPALGQRDRPTELAKPHEQVVPIQSRSIQQALDQRRAASTHMVVRHARMQSDLRGAGEAPQQLDGLP
jgi:hypothetical protein